MRQKNFKRETHNIFVAKEEISLLDFVMSSMHGISRNKAKAILTGHGVTVNKSVRTQHDFVVRPGMQVAIAKHKKSRVLNNPFVNIVYEDRWIVVINKAPGILSMAPAPHKMSVKKVLDDFYRAQKKNFTVHVVHRLDRDTSGLMVYAKSMEVRKQMEEQWREIIIDRRYAALVEGLVTDEHRVVESWLKELPSLKVVSDPTDNGGKFAATEFWKVSANERFSLLDVKLHTGRKNQIRVHMADIGHPVVGDEKYGSTLDPMKRLGLHAYLLDFYHPVTKELLEFESPCPKQFQLLSKND